MSLGELFNDLSVLSFYFEDFSIILKGIVKTCAPEVSTILLISMHLAACARSPIRVPADQQIAALTPGQSWVALVTTQSLQGHIERFSEFSGYISAIKSHIEN